MSFAKFSGRSAAGVFAFSVLFSACSVPNLESVSCTGSREAVREFYSFHFGNSMRFTSEDLKRRERFLTSELIERLRAAEEGTDPFTTGTSDIPKAFRVGECRETGEGKTDLTVLLIWRDDTRSEERTIKASAVKRGERWLIDHIDAD